MRDICVLLIVVVTLGYICAANDFEPAVNPFVIYDEPRLLGGKFAYILPKCE